MAASAIRNSYLVRSYLRVLERHPRKTMCLTTAALHAGGDVIAQKFIEKKEQLELVRTGRFFLIGLVWDGPLLSWWYRALSRAIPSATKSSTILKVVLDQGLFIPAMLGSFLVLNAALKGMDQRDIKDILKRDYLQLLVANYQLWPLAMTINFYLTPVQHQVLFTNSVSLGWNTYLSWKANQELLKKSQKFENGENECGQSMITESGCKLSLEGRMEGSMEERVEGRVEGETEGRTEGRTEGKAKGNESGLVIEKKDGAFFNCQKCKLVQEQESQKRLQEERDQALQERRRDQSLEREDDREMESKPCEEMTRKMTLLTQKWNFDFLSHPYALLPR